MDLENHERREKRMRERAQDRWSTNYTFFLGGLSEEEIKYRDYFETDLEKMPENDILQEKIDDFKVLSQEEYKLENYDF